LEDAEAENAELIKELIVFRQRQTDELTRRLQAKSAAAAAGHKHPRAIELIDDDQPPPARQRTGLEQQNGEHKSES
jgi:Flp pilus assembly protein TadB